MAHGSDCLTARRMARQKTVRHKEQARRRSQPGSSGRRRALTPCRAGTRGQYRATHGDGPRRIPLSGGDEAASARLFICAECRARALFCSCCDRGQIYCAGDCGALVRRRANRWPARVTRPAAGDSARMPNEHSATGRGEKN